MRINKVLEIMERIEKCVPDIAQSQDCEKLFNICIETINEQCENDIEDREWLLQIIILILCRCITYKNGEENMDLKQMARRIFEK